MPRFMLKTARESNSQMWPEKTRAAIASGTGMDVTGAGLLLVDSLNTMRISVLCVIPGLNLV